MELIEQPIEDSRILRQLCERVGSEFDIAVDTEFTRVRTYRPRLELVQLATKEIAFCIDVQKCGDISALRRLLSSASMDIAMHSASQDLEIFRDINAIPNQIFDTQIAASLCGYGKVSYKDVVHDSIGIELSKEMTRSNWTHRPLSQKQIQYALDDVRYLIPVKQHLSRELDQLSRMSWLEEECGRLLMSFQKESVDFDVYRSFHQAAELAIADQYRVRDLLLWRENRARKLDLPKQWVISDDSIMDLIWQRPNNEVRISKVLGLKKLKSSKWLTEVLNILLSSPDITAGPIWKTQGSMTRDEKQLIKRIMQIARDSAEEYQIPPNLICTNKEARAIVRGKYDGRVFKGWRKEIFADAIVSLLPRQGNAWVEKSS